MSNDIERDAPERQGRRRFIGAGAGLLGLAWATQANAAWRFICDRPKPCFLYGTRLETDAGLVPVEKLREGDRVKTLDGQFKAIRWVGFTRVEKEGPGAWSKLDAPVLIRKGALGAGMPHTDLRVSPHHAFYFDGVLVRAKDLVNGLNIVADTAYAADAITYYHVELDRHDIVYAEGALAETYHERNDNRALFDNAASTAPAMASLPFAPILGLSRKDRVVVHIKSALLPNRNHAGRIGEIRQAIAARANDGGTAGSRHAA
jgi:hypothetical protein